MFIEFFHRQKTLPQTHTHIVQEDLPFCSFFLFINSGSGSGLGSRLLAQQVDKIVFNIPINNQNEKKIIDVYFINLRKKQNREKGFYQLKKLSQKNKKAIPVVCGGDGTVMWVINELKNFNIDPQSTPLAVIPTGTGNDFSRATNWGGQIKQVIEQDFKQLKNLIRKWLNSKISEFDIWDLTAEVNPVINTYMKDLGYFEKVQNGESKSLPDKIYKKSFVNYCSFGIDAKIGYSFDMHRSKSRIGNLAVYGGIGLIKSISKTKTIEELVQQAYIKAEGQNISIFKSRLQPEPIFKNVDQIKSNLENILFLNINSYAGGIANIWQQGQDIFNRYYSENTPSFCDGKIQMVGFNSATALGMQKSFGGFGKKIIQHQGPFIINFRTSANRTYLQVDGEYFRFNHPKRVVIQKSKLFGNRRISVLIQNNSFLQQKCSCTSCF